MKFDKATFRIQFHNMPLACMSREVGWSIGSSVGEVEEVDATADRIGWGKFLRVKVVVDLSEPLARGRMLNVKDKQVWISIQYEQPPKFCFHCGIIKHGNRGSMMLSSKHFHGVKSKQQYGPWLRALFLKIGADKGKERYGSSMAGVLNSDNKEQLKKMGDSEGRSADRGSIKSHADLSECNRSQIWKGTTIDKQNMEGVNYG